MVIWAGLEKCNLILNDTKGEGYMKGMILEYAVGGSDAGPYGITTGKDGALWYTEQKGNRIGRSTSNGEMISFQIPTSDAGAMTIVSDHSGDLWFTENKANKIGRMSVDGHFSEYELPTADSSPFGITQGPDDAICLNYRIKKPFPHLSLKDQMGPCGLPRIRAIELVELPRKVK